MVVNIFSQRETEKARTDFSSNGLMLYNIPKEQPPQSVGKSLIVCENPWRDADFWGNYPRSGKRENPNQLLLVWVRDIRGICSFVRGGVVRVRMGRTPKHRVIRHKTAPGYAVSDAEHIDIPAQNHPGESVPREVLGQPPHLRPQRGPAALLAMGDLHTQSRKISGRGKNGQPGPADPAADLAGA